VSRFQYPGLARSLTVYCVDGLVLFVPVRWPSAEAECHRTDNCRAILAPPFNFLPWD